MYACMYHSYNYFSSICMSIIVSFTVITVGFDQPMYNIAENFESVQLTLVLSNPSSFDETIQVISTDITAIGNHYMHHTML